ncbi:MAG TPA: DUF3168 domain-containing protein [Kiloniellales bacterium]
MTDIVQALYDKLAAESAVTDLVGTRIYLGEAPQNVATPYVVYFLVGPVHDRTLEGRSRLVRSRFQLDCYDTKTANAGALSVVAIANAIREALDGFRGTVSGVSFKSVMADGDRDLTVPETRLAQRSLDLVVWHDE